MSSKEDIILKIKEEGKEEFLNYDEEGNLVISYDFPSSLISYSYKGKDGKIKSHIQCEIILKDIDAFIKMNHISTSTSIYNLLQITIDNAYKRTIYSLIKKGNDPNDLQVDDALILQELKQDSNFIRMNIELKSLLLSNFEVEIIKNIGKKSKGKKLLIAYVVIYLILIVAVLAVVIWFYKYYLEGILSSSGL
ncbi:MAG: hypothetical protein ACI4U5_04550 [Bacilli bacterium]